MSYVTQSPARPRRLLLARAFMTRVLVPRVLMPRVLVTGAVLLSTAASTATAAAGSALPMQLSQAPSSAAALSQPPASQLQQGKELWLFGGGEKLCSSVEPHYCKPDSRAAAEAFFRSSGALRAKTFFCQQRSLQLLKQLPHWPASVDASATENAGTRRDRLLAALPQSPQSASAYYALLEQLDLNGDEYSLLEDACEVRPLDPAGQPAELKLYWPGTDTATQQLFSAFVQSAKQRRDRRRDAHSDAGNNGAQSPATSAKATAPAQPEAALPEPAKVLLITASSYNPYEWVSYYRQVFQAAGAQVLWLPIEAAWSQQTAAESTAETAADCSAIERGRLAMSGQLRRAELYPAEAAEQQQFCQHPARLLQLVEQADAVFINGGDQTLTLRALTDARGQWTPVASRLLQRVREEGVPLGGSSAGNAVQAGRLAGDIAMISGGRTLSAIRHGALAGEADVPGCALTQSCLPAQPPGQLTYRASGGLQLFSLGSNDTHFRERQREGRLLRLVLDSGSGAGVGVDEATVLRANFSDESSATLEVLGHGGVWLLDAGGAKGRLATVDALAAEALATQALANTQQSTVEGLMVSRLLAGSSIHWQRREGQQALVSELRTQDPLSCTPQAVDAQQLDAGAYAPLQDDSHGSQLSSQRGSQLSWQLNWQVGNAGKASGCQRADGQWQYLQQPLRVTLEVTPAMAGNNKSAGGGAHD